MPGFQKEIERAARRLHDYVGRDLSVVTREKVGTDSRNNPVFNETSVITTGEIVPRGSANFSNEVYGAEVDYDVTIFIPDTIAVDDGSGVNDASRIVDQHGAGEYRVVTIHRESHTGRYALQCERL